jgi:hypothetical protein
MTIGQTSDIQILLFGHSDPRLRERRVPFSGNQQNMKDNKMKKIIGLILGLGLAASAGAATTFNYWTGADSENFGTYTNWKLSNPNGNQVMNGAGTGITSLAGITRTVGSLHVRDGHTFNINMTTNQITSSTAFRIGETSTTNASTVYLNSGTVSVGTVFSMSSETDSATSFFTATNGSLSAATMKIGTIAEATFTLEGDESTIDVSGALTAGAYSTFSFQFDETGVSTISADSITIDNAATLLIDGADYTGGNASFTLFAATTTDSFSNITVTGFGTIDTDYTLTQTDSAITLNVIPEPATIGLMGMGTVALFMARRRIAKK